MTEDELLQAVMEACGFRTALYPEDVAQHQRRSDLAVIQGTTGLPDVLGVVGDTLIAWELKTDTGRPSADQVRWLRALQRVEKVDARIVRPADLDAIIAQLLAGRMIGRVMRGDT